MVDHRYSLHSITSLFPHYTDLANGWRVELMGVVRYIATSIPSHIYVSQLAVRGNALHWAELIYSTRPVI